MRKLLLLALVFALVSCSPTVAPDAKRAYIYNSNWELVAMPEVLASRAVLPIDAETFVDDYNAAHNDDQLFVMDAPTDITEAPTAKITFAYADTNEIWETWPALDRALVKGNRDGWALQLDIESMKAGRPCSLYVDKEPPPIQEPPLPNLWVALVNTTTGEVFYSEYWTTVAEANSRYQSMVLQAEINNLHPESMGAGVWQAYIGPTEYGTTP